jgi:hypothetical protein
MVGAPLGVAQHLPGGIQRQDRVLIPTRIRVVLLHQGAVGSLDLLSAGGPGHAEHLVVITTGRGPGQGHGAAAPILPEAAPTALQAQKKPPMTGGLVKGFCRIRT